MDHGEISSLILLDLSTTFDTVNHSISILHTSLQYWFDLCFSINWFLSYLAVSVNDQIFHLSIIFSLSLVY